MKKKFSDEKSLNKKNNQMKKAKELGEVCSECWTVSGKLYAFDKLSWCNECLSEKTRICSDCGERCYHEEISCVPDNLVCNECYDKHYSQCVACDGFYRNEENYAGDGRCENCISENLESRSDKTMNNKLDTFQKAFARRAGSLLWQRLYLRHLWRVARGLWFTPLLLLSPW
jgi:hypothetical protein